jgi:hypothetical protein
VEIPGLLIANKALRHWGENTPREPGFALSHISILRCGKPRPSTLRISGSRTTNPNPPFSNQGATSAMP